MFGVEYDMVESWQPIFEMSIPLTCGVSLGDMEHAMSHTLTLPDELYVKLAEGAAERGLTIESLLAFVSELVSQPDRRKLKDGERSRSIERLFAKYSAAGLTEQELARLDRLIGLDYDQANVRADRLISAKNGPGSVRQEKSGKRSRK
jgi:hypothetical protein